MVNGTLAVGHLRLEGIADGLPALKVKVSENTTLESSQIINKAQETV